MNDMHRIGILSLFGASSGQYIRGVELGIHGIRLASINHEQYLVVSMWEGMKRDRKATFHETYLFF